MAGLLDGLFMRVAARCGGMLVGRVAVFMGRCGVRLSFVVFALRVMVSGLMVMVGRGVMSCSGIVMMLACGMLGRLSHSKTPRERVVDKAPTVRDCF